MTVPGVEPTPEETARRYGVTVGDVRDLASHVNPNPTFNDPHFGNDPMDPTVTDAMVAKWIDNVADSVRARVTVLAQYSTNEGRWAAITGSAKTATLVGAAAWLVSANYPMKAGTNNESYSAELWTRYTDELAYLSTTLPGLFDDQDDEGVVDPVTGRTGVQPRVTMQYSNIPQDLFYRRDPYGQNYGQPPAPGSENGWRGYLR